MILPQNSTNYINEHRFDLPKNPKPFEIFTAPDNQYVGASTVLLLVRDSKTIGDMMSLFTQHNVANTLVGYRTRTTTPISQGDVLTIVTSMYRYRSLIYVEYFGWVGIDPDPEEKKKVLDRFDVRVEYANEIILTGQYYAYDQMCLRRIET